MNRARHGFIFTDVLFGLIIISVLATTLVVALNRRQQVSMRLENARAATRLCELAVSEMRTGHWPEPQPRLHWKIVQAPQTPAGQQWVEVSAEYEGAHGSLVALVPVVRLGEVQR